MPEEKQSEFGFVAPVVNGRLPNGVRARRDGKGDGWANMHRTELGSAFYFQDFDGVFGQMMFAQNTGNSLFMEYVPDDYHNRANKVRCFALVALFDRKRNYEAAFGQSNTLQTAFYLWFCRSFAMQPVEPRFFYVVGGSAPPWTMHEIDIHSGERVKQTEILTNSIWSKLWSELGLAEARRRLRVWIEANGET